MKRMRMRPDAEPGEMGSQEVGGPGPMGATDARRPDGAAIAGGFSRARGERKGFLVKRYGQALGARLSGEGLVIEQAPDRFVIIRDDSRRSYIPGAHSVVSVADGVADQVSGWKGRQYVIDVKPQVGPRLTERYNLSADGHLIETVSLREDGLPGLEFTRVYDAGPAPARALPTSN